MLLTSTLATTQKLHKGNGNPDDYYVYMKDLNKPWILIPVSSKSDEKRRSCGRLNICKWTVMEAAILWAK